MKILNARNQIVVIKKFKRSKIVGTFGLKGVILEAKLKLTKTKDILKANEKFYSINQMKILFSNFENKIIWAWIDHFSKELEFLNVLNGVRDQIQKLFTEKIYLILED